MRSGICFAVSFVLGVALGLVVGVKESPGEGSGVDDFQKLAMNAVRAAVITPGENGCTLENARVRRDWEALSKTERRDYIRAVNCIWDMPSVAPSFSAAQNYFDEFVAIHLNLTDSIHDTGYFLTWHRYLLHLWEETLRADCGYAGALPYWNWFKYQDRLWESPLFDGSDTSLGGDGEFLRHNGSLVGGGKVWLPSGKGGGCVREGPFVNRTLHLGPIHPAMQSDLPIMKTQHDFNPRCPHRDLTVAASAAFTPAHLYDLLAGANSSTVEAFQDELQNAAGVLRMHGAGHYSVGGDAADVFSSLNDPSFYQHHAMVDRVYWMWQALHPGVKGTVAGTLTRGNVPPSREVSVEDELDLGVLGERVRIGDVLDTLGGTPLCYVYE